MAVVKLFCRMFVARALVYFGMFRLMWDANVGGQLAHAARNAPKKRPAIVVLRMGRALLTNCGHPSSVTKAFWQCHCEGGQKLITHDSLLGPVSFSYRVKLPQASDAARTRLQLFGGICPRTPFNQMPESHPGQFFRCAHSFPKLLCVVGHTVLKMMSNVVEAESMPCGASNVSPLFSFEHSGRYGN